MTLMRKSRPYRILIVDDVEIQQISITTLLKRIVSNCEMVVADSVESATGILRSEALPFDLAIVDLNLEAEADGLDVLGTIKQVLARHAQTEVFIYTQFPSVETACKAYEAGASAYRSKQGSDAEFKKVVIELLERQDLKARLRDGVAAQNEAEKALVDNRQEWVAKYGGNFVAVRDGKVIANSIDPADLWKMVEQCPTEEQLRTGIVEVPKAEK